MSAADDLKDLGAQGKLNSLQPPEHNDSEDVEHLQRTPVLINGARRIA